MARSLRATCSAWQFLALLGAALVRGVVGQSACSCGCCEVVHRRPTMQINGVALMCTSAEASCDAQCQAGDENTLDAATTAGMVDTGRYCFFDCIPVSNNIADGCQEIHADMVSQLVAPGGGQDPASLAQPAEADLAQEMAPRVDMGDEQEAVEAADEQGFQDAAVTAIATAGQKTMKEAIKQQEGETGVIVANAAGKRAYAAALDARSSRAEVTAAGAMMRSTAAVRSATMDGHLANDAKGKLQSAAVRAELYARSATESLRRANIVLEEIKNAASEAAEEAAQEAAREISAETAKWHVEKADEERRLLQPTTPPELTAVGEQVAAPYYAAMQQDMAAQFAFQEQGRQFSAQEDALRHSADVLRKQAKQYKDAGKAKMAQKLLKQARGLERQAEGAEMAGESAFAGADKMSKGVHKYEDYAEAAAVRASRLSRDYWMPPPVKFGAREWLGPATDGAAGGVAAGGAPGPAPAGGLLLLAKARRGGPPLRAHAP